VNRAVPWREAALVAVVCWVVSGLGHGVLAALDEPRLSVAPLIGMGLVQWFWTRHRFWPAAVAAGLAGIAVLFALVDALRPDLGRYVADTLATGAAATVALVVVFALAGRGAGRRREAARRPVDSPDQPALSAGTPAALRRSRARPGETPSPAGRSGRQAAARR
jgi:uncharacterized membrane protein YoaK (UPF0700 family)